MRIALSPSPRRRLAAIIIILLCAAAWSPAQTLTVLASFNGTDGTGPNALIQGKDGNFYGTSYLGGDVPQPVVARFFR